MKREYFLKRWEEVEEAVASGSPHLQEIFQELKQETLDLVEANEILAGYNRSLNLKMAERTEELQNLLDKLKEEQAFQLAYNNLVTALNASVELSSLLKDALRGMLEFCQAQAGILYLFEQKQIYLGVWKKEGLKLIKKENLDDNKRELFEEIRGKYIGTNGYVAMKEKETFEVKRWLGKNEDAFTHREVYKGATAILWLYQNHLETLKSILGDDHELIKNIEEIIFPTLDFLERYIKEIHYMLLYSLTKNKDKNILYQRFIGVIDPILKAILGIKGKLNFEKSHQFSHFLNHTTVGNNGRKL